MTKKQNGGFDARHNIDAKKAAKILGEEITRALNLSAEALAGGSFKKNAIGIRSVFTHDSKGTGRPSPVSKPPGVDTGTLRRSFRTRPAERKGASFRVTAGSDVLYARMHELGLGTPKRPFMAKGIRSATPFIRRVFSKLGPKIRSRIQNESRSMR